MRHRSVKTVLCYGMKMLVSWISRPESVYLFFTATAALLKYGRSFSQRRAIAFDILRFLNYGVQKIALRTRENVDEGLSWVQHTTFYLQSQGWPQTKEEHV